MGSAVGVRQERWPQCRRHLFIDVLPRLERGDDGGQVDVVMWEVFVVDDHFGVLVGVEIGQVNPVATDVVGVVKTDRWGHCWGLRSHGNTS